MLLKKIDKNCKLQISQSIFGVEKYYTYQQKLTGLLYNITFLDHLRIRPGSASFLLLLLYHIDLNTLYIPGELRVPLRSIPGPITHIFQFFLFSFFKPFLKRTWSNINKNQIENEKAKNLRKLQISQGFDHSETHGSPGIYMQWQAFLLLLKTHLYVP